jgi:hypothetical protein
LNIHVRAGGVAIAIFLGAVILARPVALAQEGTVVEEIVVESPGLRSANEIRALVSPVAILPDDLLAVVLLAAANPFQIAQAGRYLKKNQADFSQEPDPDWDLAIRALIDNPDVIQAMNDDLDWTEQLGRAFIDQRSDVLATIQRMRAGAKAVNVTKLLTLKKATQRPGEQPLKLSTNRGLGDYQVGRSTAKQGLNGQKSLVTSLGSTSRKSQVGKAVGALAKSTSKLGASRSRSASVLAGTDGSKYVPVPKSRGSKSPERSGS